MPRPEKEKLVEELSAKLSGSQITILTDYTGLNVQAMTILREQFRKSAAEYHVYKNTLARIAAQKSGLEGVLKFMEGPTGYVFSDDPVTPSKILTDFVRTNPNLKVKCAVLSGGVVDGIRVREIANLPPREILLAQLLGQMNAPIARLANVLSGPIRKLVYVLEDIRKKKEAA